MLSWLLGNPARIQPLAVSKANTLAQIVLAATVLADEGFQLGLGAPRVILVWVTAALTIASLAAYIRAWHRHMSGFEFGIRGSGGRLSELFGGRPMRINRHVLFWLSAFVALILVLALLKDILLPFVAGMIIAYFLDPLADRLVAAGVNRTAASALIVAVGGALVIGLVILSRRSYPSRPSSLRRRSPTRPRGSRTSSRLGRAS